MKSRWRRHRAWTWALTSAARRLSAACSAVLALLAAGVASDGATTDASSQEGSGAPLGPTKDVRTTNPLMTESQARQVARSIDPSGRWLLFGESRSEVWSLLATVVILDVLPVDGILAEGGQLLVAGVLARGDPSLHERLCLRSPHGFVVVREASGLAGRVRIDSPEAAVRFLRLFTSPATVKCLRQPWWVEVVPRSTVDEHFLLGRHGVVPLSSELLKCWPSGRYGILSESDWHDGGLTRLQVERVDEGFVVTRWMFRARLRWGYPGTDVVYHVRETISCRGEINREVLQEIKLPHIRLVVPARI